MILVVDVDDGVDVARDPHLRDVLECANQVLPRPGVLRDEVVDLGAIAVQRHVDVREARRDGLLEEASIGEALPVGDHPTVEAALLRVAQRRQEQRRERGLAAREDDAVVLQLDQVIDLGAQPLSSSSTPVGGFEQKRQFCRQPRVSWR